MNLATVFITNARARPDHSAIIAAGETINHGTAAEWVKTLAAWLAARGVTADDRIGLMLPDTPLHLLLHYSLAWLGATIVPLDHRWTQVEAARIARAMKVKAVLGETDGELDGMRVMAAPGGWPEAGSAPLPVAAEGGERPLVLSLSSGTTGSPTGAIVTHAQLYERFVAQWVTMTFNALDRYLLATPLYFGGGRSFAMSFLAAGATVAFAPPPLEPIRLIGAARDYRASVVFLVPTQIRRILADWDGIGPAFPDVRLVVTSGSAIHAQERAEIVRRVCANCLDYYASSEGGGIAVLQPREQLQFPQTVGCPTFRVEIALVDEHGDSVPTGVVGRLRYKGPGVSRVMIDARGENIDLADRDGWFEPGDLAKMLPTGHLILAGRTKDVIIRGGINIYPAEVEAALIGLPGIAEVLVVGLPDAELGERVGALLVTSNEPMDLGDLRAALAPRLASYKLPSDIRYVEHLPRTLMNKPDRAMAKKILAGDSDP